MSTAGIVPWQKTKRSSSERPKLSFSARNAIVAFVRDRAGHEVHGHADARAASPGRSPSRGATERASRRRPGRSGTCPFGLSNPSRLPCPPATSSTPTLPASSAARPIFAAIAADGVTPRPPPPPRLAVHQTHRDRGLRVAARPFHASRADRRRRLEQRGDLREVDRLEPASASVAWRSASAASSSQKLEHVVLAVLREALVQFGGGGHLA